MQTIWALFLLQIWRIIRWPSSELEQSGYFSLKEKERMFSSEKQSQNQSRQLFYNLRISRILKPNLLFWWYTRQELNLSRVDSRVLINKGNSSQCLVTILFLIIRRKMNLITHSLNNSPSNSTRSKKKLTLKSSAFHMTKRSHYTKSSQNNIGTLLNLSLI